MVMMVGSGVFPALLVLSVFMAGATAIWWGKADFEGPPRTVSVGFSGVWGLSTRGQIWYRNDTYRKFRSTGNAWVGVEPGAFNTPSQLDVGKNAVWGVDASDKVFYRDGISANNPTGDQWVMLKDSPSMKQVAVSGWGRVWAVGTDNRAWFLDRSFVDDSNDMRFVLVNNSINLEQISAGKAGVWAVSPEQEVYYRNGTHGAPPYEGSSWIKVDSQRLKYISSGRTYAIGVNSADEIYLRQGVSEQNPGGTSWKKLNGTLSVIDGYRPFVWGIYRGKVKFGKIKSEL